MEKPPRIAVIGTGRSGTGFMAALLRAHGFKAGHERWFTFRDAERVPDLDVDCSFMALPDIEAARWSGKVLHVTRNPYDVAASFLGIGLFTPHSIQANAHMAWIARHAGIPDLGDRPLTNVLDYWSEWNLRCAAVADATVQVEGMQSRHGLALASQVVGMKLNQRLSKTIPTNVNERDTVELDKDVVWDLVGERARRFGYTKSESYTRKLRSRT